MESWDDENFEPQVVKQSVPVANKWEGEDEEENVKESWEDEEEEQKPAEKVEIVEKEVPSKPKKKSLQQIIAEKERLKQEEQERRLKELQEEENELSPAERLLLEQQSDLTFALETTFQNKASQPTESDKWNPQTKEEFQELVDELERKITPLAKNAEYPLFAENLARSLCAPLNSFDIKKIKTTIDNLYLEKQKLEKGDKAKKSKGKGKARIKVEDDNQFSAYVGDYDDFDDFM